MSQFSDLGLSKSITDALHGMGYESPTKIQEIAIPQILSSPADLKAFAQTGTGKTAAFGLPILELFNPQHKACQALILSPTRELALQIAKNLEEFGKNIQGLKVATLYGGAPVESQQRLLKKGPQIVVGTPGRTLDFLKRKHLNLNNLRWLILDEADEMLNMGFKDELDKILDYAPYEKQSLLFSATFPKEVEEISKNYLMDPFELRAGKMNVGADKVTHHYYQIQEKHRYLSLKRVTDLYPEIYGIVFCRTRKETKDVAQRLITDGYNADALHGDLSQAQRDLVMHRFRNKNIQILVATDVAARGLDVNDLTHVIHYKVPDQIENYTHRSGRTGRAGKEGLSIALLNKGEVQRVRSIEKQIKKEFVHKQIPTGKEICAKQLLHWVDKVHDIEVNQKEIAPYLPEVEAKLSGLDREELIKRMVSIEFNQFLSYYENEVDLNAEPKKKSAENFTRFYINKGKSHNLNPARLLGLINEYVDEPQLEIGKIEILKNFSFFEASSSYKRDVLDAMNTAVFQRKPVLVEVTEAPKKRRGKKSKRKKHRGRR